MDYKKYYNKVNKEYQDNLKITVTRFSNSELTRSIENQQERIKEGLYCKIATKTKVNRLLKMLLKEQNKRGI